jgi:hypothetical protein
MKKILSATKFVAVMLSLTLLAVPALAAQTEQENFHAMSAISSDEQMPTTLTDEQLAAVEGGDHMTLAAALLAIAAGFAAGADPVSALAYQQGAAAVLLLNPAAHPINASICCP